MKSLSAMYAWIIVLVIACASIYVVPSTVNRAVSDVKKDVKMLQAKCGYLQSRLEGTYVRLNKQEDILTDLTKTNLYPELQAITVRVDVGFGCGTGVLVTRQVGDVTRTFVWTAGHVAKCVRQDDGTFGNLVIYQERRKDGKYIDTVKTDAKVIAYSDPDAGDDLALLEVLKDNFTTVSATFDLGDMPLAVGTELVHVGCTLGLYNSVSLGVISQTDRDILETGKMFDQTSCMGYPGSSGGGVYLAKSDKCIGLLVRGAGPGLNFIVPVRRMVEWAKKMKIEWAMNPCCKMPVQLRMDNPIDDGTGPEPVESEPSDEVEPLPPGGPSDFPFDPLLPQLPFLPLNPDLLV